MLRLLGRRHRHGGRRQLHDNTIYTTNCWRCRHHFLLLSSPAVGASSATVFLSSTGIWKANASLPLPIGIRAAGGLSVVINQLNTCLACIYYIEIRLFHSLYVHSCTYIFNSSMYVLSYDLRYHSNQITVFWLLLQ